MKSLNRTTKQILALIITTCAFLLGALPGYSQPSTSVSAPTLPQGQVISLWNSRGTYTNVPAQNYFEVWYAADPYFYTMPDTGSNVLLYADMSCCAAITTGTNPPVNASGCTNLHVDVFTPTGNNLKIRLVDTSNRAGNVLYSVAGGVITNNGWIGLDIPLALFTSDNPLLNLASIRQIGWIDSEGGGGEVLPASYYIDNVYFGASTNLVFTPPPVIPTPTNNAPTPTNTPALSLYNSSGTYTDVTAQQWPTFWSGSPCTDFVITNPPGSTVKYLPGLSYVGVQYYPNTVNTTGYNTLHFDVWTLDGNQLAIQLVSLNPTAAAQVMSSIASTQQWVSVNIPLSQFAAANPGTVLTNIEQVLFVDNVGPGIQNATFYIDNVYFYSNSVAPPVVINYPTNAAPNPTAAQANVVSLYNSSGSYTNVHIDTWLAGWSVANYSEYLITNATRTVKRYGSLDYAGVEFFTPRINASAMGTFHVDLWTPNASKFSVKLVSGTWPATQEYEVVFTNNVIVTNQWVSLNIPLTTFTTGNPSLNLSDLGQLLFINNNPGGPQLGTFYIDNVYFYSAGVTPPTILPPAISGGNIVMQVNSVNGTAYVLQATPSLSPATWTAIQTNAGTGGILNFTNPVTAGNQFFRIKTQ